ncbi:LysR substrate-binding domain-containing protein [Actinomyces vulturis]|uniref:LysR substrate-binding domain-containing protein n=1 Tax=Actinomyces vulturis TaxID=1857645 RepID=UPI00082ADB19|nr:LysR substrate-binding domain-containing protein [Actinomyces vulturis]
MPNNTQPSFSQLRGFVALCQYQHFGEAAASMGVSQPSLSQSITALERRVGGELVERTTRRVLITPLGETLLPFAREAVFAAEAFGEAVDTHGTALSGLMRIGLIPTLAPYVAPLLMDTLPDHLEQLRPEFRELVTGDILDSLTQGTLDAAVIALDVDLDLTRFAVTPMYDEPLVALVPADHEWAGRDDVDVTSLDSANLLLLDESNCLRDQTLALCQHYSSRPPRAVATTLATVTRLVAHGAGVTVIPEGGLSLMTSIEGLAVARFANASPRRHIGLVHRISSSRGAEFTQLATVMTEIIKKAGLPTEEATPVPAGPSCPVC